LSHLEHCSELQDLMLDSTKVTEAGLSKLKGLTNLRMLDLTYLLTDESLARVREWFPQVRILPLKLENEQGTP
jgi:hypothetical protein